MSWWTNMQRAMDGVFGRCVLSNRWIAQTYPFRQPPVLLISYPRSGSSWIGQILALSPDLAYLREPVTQPYLATFPVSTAVETVLDPRDNPADEVKYRRLADQAFLGIPPRELTRDHFDWDSFQLRQRRARRLLIKEVNPLAARWYAERYSPQMLVLVRHPAAVADSYVRAGWMTDQFYEFGQTYARHLQTALVSIGQLSHRVLVYEEFTQRPEVQFRELFKKLGVRAPLDFSQQLQHYCEAVRPPHGMYDIRRESRHEAGKWRKNLAAPAIAELRRGYLTESLPYYRDAHDW